MTKKLVIAISFLISAGLSFVYFSTINMNPSSLTPPDNLSYKEGNKYSFPIIAAGDLQRTSLWEKFLGRENNDLERKEIIENISEQNPGSLILLGDMVFEGDNSEHWKYFDSLIVPLKRKNISMFPVIGNHEYLGINTVAFQYLTNRFPALKTNRWYTEVCDSIALIFLDSNDGEYSAKQWQSQINWFENKLILYDNDQAIKGILVFAHHPPYTNSEVTGDEMQVQLGFLPAFEKSKKTLAFITGHAHTYERFVEAGKTFIVSGGGGGPRVLLKTGPDSHHDYYKGPSPRPFNYLLINKLNDGLEITIRGVNKGSSKFFILEQFMLPFDNANEQLSSEYP